MARCEVCARKLADPSARFCGPNGCIARAADRIQRCVYCGNLLKDGRICPATITRCTPPAGAKFVNAEELRKVV